MTTDDLVIDDRIFDMWDQFVQKKKEIAQTDEWAFCDDMSNESISDLSTMLESELVSDDMVPQVLCVKFINGDIFYYYFGQCVCHEYDCHNCQCLGRGDETLQREMVRVSMMAVVSDCYQLSHEEKSLVTMLYHPDNLNDHMAALAKPKKESNVTPVKLADALFDME